MWGGVKLPSCHLNNLSSGYHLFMSLGCSWWGAKERRWGWGGGETMRFYLNTVCRSPRGNPHQDSGALATKWRTGSGGMSVRLSLLSARAEVEAKRKVLSEHTHTHTQHLLQKGPSPSLAPRRSSRRSEQADLLGITLINFSVALGAQGGP